MDLSGSLVALITPFRDRAVDEASLAGLIDRQVAGGTAGIVVLGSTGEAALLSHAEQERVVRVAAAAAGGRVPVIAGATASGTDEAGAKARMVAAAGADALLIASPYYTRPTPEGMYQHFAQLASLTDLPIILYNIPSRTAVSMPADLVLRLAALPTVVAIKESSGNLDLASDIIADAPAGFDLIAGEDSLTLPLLAVGAIGVISVCANLVPRESADLVAAVLRSDLATARRLHYAMLPLLRALSLETNPGPLKAACADLGLCTDEVRLPVMPARPETRERLRAALAQLATAPAAA